MQVLIILLVCIFVFFSSKRKTNTSSLSPFEYGGTQNEKSASNLTGAGLSNEKSIVFLILIFTVPAIFYFAINYLINAEIISFEFYQNKFQYINIIVEGITVVVLIRVIFSLQNIKIKPALIALVFIQLAIFIYHIYQEFLKQNIENL